ncbi:MAG: CRR6 family NdhI maturation factor [Pseudanabaenaceae cyanobacterium SKYGB_i_bin29]|nr:CRR6 family NdhI maturation factor [Pseudanabaenaceae cyanobacterium SKYG29]MDW8422594.1 CRR6 family NdhI maturation factor [Pseudanabaenaceae cyanobacterium SKYGB_i_bin29]
MITVDHASIVKLNLACAHSTIASLIQGELQQSLRFQVLYDRDPADPRELSEIPEVRLWFIRLDSYYPWLPYILDWREELGRYTAMLVPHRFSQAEGIEFYPEALEIFVMSKLCTIDRWLKGRGIVATTKLQQMVQVLGYEIDAAFFQLLND